MLACMVWREQKGLFSEAGRQAISNGDMLAILASMAVPETPQMMRNELKKKLFPKDVSHT